MPLAEIKTAGVIIAVNTASDEVNGSMNLKNDSSESERVAPNLECGGLTPLSPAVSVPGALAMDLSVPF